MKENKKINLIPISALGFIFSHSAPVVKMIAFLVVVFFLGVFSRDCCTVHHCALSSSYLSRDFGFCGVLFCFPYGSCKN